MPVRKQWARLENMDRKLLWPFSLFTVISIPCIYTYTPIHGVWRGFGNRFLTNIYSSNLHAFKREVGSSFHLWHFSIGLLFTYQGRQRREVLLLPEIECKVLSPWFVKTQGLSGAEILKRSWLAQTKTTAVMSLAEGLPRTMWVLCISWAQLAILERTHFS